jgi:signal transduction histidine kinase
MADALHIQQVIINLARNSIEAMGEKGAERRVVIRTAVDGDRSVRVEIEDTGRGIPTDIGPRLFEPFFTTKPGSMGIGLLVCQRIIEAHGGHLSIGRAPSAVPSPPSRFPARRPAAKKDSGEPGIANRIFLGISGKVPIFFRMTDRFSRRPRRCRANGATKT